MFIYGKTSSNAIAVMSYLAALPEGERADSLEISKARKISRALAAKLLTQLAAAGLVNGRQGPGGGYALDRPPEKISFLEIVSIFEQMEPASLCPFGQGWCGRGTPCPLHHTLKQMVDENRRFLTKTTLAVFAGSRTEGKRAKCRR